MKKRKRRLSANVATALANWPALVASVTKLSREELAEALQAELNRSPRRKDFIVRLRRRLMVLEMQAVKKQAEEETSDMIGEEPGSRYVNQD